MTDHPRDYEGCALFAFSTNQPGDRGHRHERGRRAVGAGLAVATRGRHRRDDRGRHRCYRARLADFLATGKFDVIIRRLSQIQSELTTPHMTVSTGMTTCGHVSSPHVHDDNQLEYTGGEGPPGLRDYDKHSPFRHG